jgi:hypothetical protein
LREKLDELIAKINGNTEEMRKSNKELSELAGKLDKVIAKTKAKNTAIYPPP